MPRLSNLKVVTFSSEDPGQPASNLVSTDHIKKWKCMSEGEKEASVVLKNDTAVQISSIDVGNNGSAFIEVHVGRSGSHPQEYEILLSTFALMSPVESRGWTSTNRVRMFGSGMLNKNVLSQKWDLFKFVCTQPFNTHVQYGLTFVYVNSTSDIVEKKAERTIGSFRILPPSGDEEADTIKVGSLFNKKTNPAQTQKSTTSTSTAATIRQASTALLASSSSSSPKGNSPSVVGKRKLVDDADDSPSRSSGKDKAQKLFKDSDSSSSSSDQGVMARKSAGKAAQSSKTTGHVTPSSKVSGASKNIHTTSNPSNGSPKSVSNSKSSKSPKVSASTTNKTANRVPQPSSRGAQQKASSSKPTRTKIRKPFNKLLDGVVFTISGYENPYRTTMRKKAIEMGAVCKPDWDPTCTHLICAFVNTPKFRYVRSSSTGKIVKMKWIEDCYNQRKRLGWRKYWLDSRDNISDSDEEICALSEQETDEIDTEEEVTNSSSTQPAVIKDKDNNSEEKVNNESELSEEEGVAKTHPPRFNRMVLSSTDDEADEYENETDGKEVEMDEEKSGFEFSDLAKSKAPTPPSPQSNFFRYLNFYLDPEMEESMKVSISTHVTDHKGTVAQQMDDTVEYYVTDSEVWKEAFSESLSENPSLTFVKKEFIYQSVKLGNMATPSEFMLLPV